MFPWRRAWSDINRQAIYTLSPSVVPGKTSVSGLLQLPRNIFERSLETMRVRYHFVILGYIVMPEHVHLLVSERKNAPLSKAIQALKLSVAVQREPAAVLAGSLLRFQRIHECKTSREVEIHAPQSRRTRLGRRTGRVGIVASFRHYSMGGDRNGAHRELSWNDSGSAAINSHISESRCGAPRGVSIERTLPQISEREIWAPHVSPLRHGSVRGPA